MLSKTAARILYYPRTLRLWRKFRSLTMVPKKRFFDNLFLARYYTQRNNLSGGCYVECGTWAGGTSFSIMSACRSIKQWYFFDSFEGLPTAGPKDGAHVKEKQKSGRLLHNNNMADYETFVKNLEKTRRGDQKVKVHKGWFNETLPTSAPTMPISILRLDGDWYDSIMVCLEHLFDKVVQGGLIIIDDYYDNNGCSRAVHDFLSRRSSVQRIRQSAKGIAYIIIEEEQDITSPQDD